MDTQWGWRVQARAVSCPERKRAPQPARLLHQQCRSTTEGWQCRFVLSYNDAVVDSSGSAVDWWAILKHADGTGYLYADATSPSFAVSSHLVSDLDSGAVANTLLAAFEESYAMYNDEEPDDGATAWRWMDASTVPLITLLLLITVVSIGGNVGEECGGNVGEE